MRPARAERASSRAIRVLPIALTSAPSPQFRAIRAFSPSGLKKPWNGLVSQLATSSKKETIAFEVLASRTWIRIPTTITATTTRVASRTARASVYTTTSSGRTYGPVLPGRPEPPTRCQDLLGLAAAVGPLGELVGVVRRHPDRRIRQRVAERLRALIHHRRVAEAV